MDLTTYVSHLGREFATLAEAGGEESRALVERLTGSLESAIRMTLLEALAAAADEITSDLAPGSVQVRLQGRDPQFLVTVPSAEPATATNLQQAAPLAESDPATFEDGPSSRINVRLPETLKTAVEEAAAKEGRSVNAWLVRAATVALHRSQQRDQAPETTLAPSAKQGFTGWVR
ncbi:YlcI/YnfO family protein [Amycolatopsis sp. cg5]|uniref:YlcI/YnfO family protein n=1 Tax=Amycolatopsis sp. cg5 TaxID=3238802 RepID=UPI003524213D